MLAPSQTSSLMKSLYPDVAVPHKWHLVDETVEAWENYTHTILRGEVNTITMDCEKEAKQIFYTITNDDNGSYLKIIGTSEILSPGQTSKKIRVFEPSVSFKYCWSADRTTWLPEETFNGEIEHGKLNNIKLNYRTRALLTSCYWQVVSSTSPSYEKEQDKLSLYNYRPDGGFWVKSLTNQSVTKIGRWELDGNVIVETWERGHREDTYRDIIISISETQLISSLSDLQHEHTRTFRAVPFD